MKAADNVSLSDFCGYGCGGPAERIITLESRSELHHINDILDSGIPWHIIGSGYNTLVSDMGFSGTVIRLGGDFDSISSDKDRIICGAAVKLPALLKYSVEAGLSGLEYLAGIPGTVGGSVMGNSGSAESGIIKNLSRVEAYDISEGVLRTIGSARIDESYRNSGLSGKLLITETVFNLKTEDKSDIIEKIEKNMLLKSGKQPIREKSCGCVFKNPSGTEKTAGQLIQEAGFSGKSLNGAVVSEMHSNFIINTGEASALDIWELIKAVRQGVRQNAGIELELEIVLLGDGFE